MPLGVLVIEKVGERSISGSFNGTLHHDGFRITQVTSMAEIREAVRKNHLDAVLIDLDSDTAVGDLALIRQVRLLVPHLPIIAISHEDHDDLAVQAVQAGAEEYVAKEGGGRDLLRKVRCSTLRHARSRLSGTSRNIEALEALLMEVEGHGSERQ